MSVRDFRSFWRSCYEQLRGCFDGRAGAEQSVPAVLTPDDFSRALAIHQQGNLDEAESLYRTLLQQQPDNADLLQFLGVVRAQRGQPDEAVELIGRALAINPNNAVAHANLGNVYRVLSRRQNALECYDRALALAPANLEALINRAAVLVELGRSEAALADYAAVLAFSPGHREIQRRCCEVLTTLQRFEEALSGYEQALQGDPGDVDVLFHCGVLLVTLRRYAEAVKRYDQALVLKPEYAEILNNRGIALWHDRRYEDALDSYDRALAIRPDYADALYNRGIVLAGLNRHAEAVTSYDRAIAANPGYARAYSNRGAALARLDQQDAALASYDRALELNPRLTDALNNRGGIFRKMELHERAAQDYASLLELDPEYEHAAGNKLYSDAWSCDWARFAESRTGLLNAVRAGRRPALPFQVAVLTDSAPDQLVSARTHVTQKYPAAVTPLWNGERYQHDRIRIAYLSADFREHATTHLMAGLFERHDRERFEVTAWSFGPDVRDDMRARLEKSFEQFNDVSVNSDFEIASMLRAHEVDIAVDLKGFTDGCRPAIFCQRAAPVQVNYLGYPGTTGAGYMDYIIADAEVIPEGHEGFYAEQVVRLPDSYQVNDARREIAEHAPRRAEAGLPESGFVFCCFNNNYKITPEVFGVWMRLLRQVGGSVLWLLEDNAAASRNLRREAEARGVGAERLVFAPRLLPPEHLARHRLGDLFLDTLPCNAHTTASDALWAGLPVLTCRGHAFPGRVAASLLRAIGLPELITDDLAGYEALALQLATTPALLAEIRSRLARNRTTHPLFDIERYRRHIESAYITMVEQQRQGKKPRGFAVMPIA